MHAGFAAWAKSVLVIHSISNRKRASRHMHSGYPHNPVDSRCALNFYKGFCHNILSSSVLLAHLACDSLYGPECVFHNQAVDTAGVGCCKPKGYSTSQGTPKHNYLHTRDSMHQDPPL